jgi:hypothetical protein
VFALLLIASSFSQQTPTFMSEPAAASAFESAMQGEGGLKLKRIYKKRLQDLCAADARRWGDGVMGFDRITFMNEPELTSKMLALVRQWKTTGSQGPRFYASDFPQLRRYAVANCGLDGGQSKVVVAVYRSAWETYWDNWANLLGK